VAVSKKNENIKENIVPKSIKFNLQEANELNKQVKDQGEIVKTLKTKKASKV
jgi:hypothetical protein